MKIFVATIIWLGVSAAQATGQELFVQSTVAPLWTAPSGRASPVGILSLGMKVRPLKENDHWYYVRHNNQHGWILKMRLGLINPHSGLAAGDAKSLPGAPIVNQQPSIIKNVTLHSEH